MLRSLANAAAWMVAFRLADRSLGVISTLVLARLLIPEDFGIVAMASSVIALIELVNSFGLDNALIHVKEPQRRHYDTAFTLNALLGVGCGALIAGLGPAAAAFYRDPRLESVMYVLAIAWAVTGFENVGTVDFRRRMEFQREFVYLASRRVVGFVVTIVAAFVLRSYWALILGMTVGRVAMTLLSYAFHPYRPGFSLGAVRELLSFSVWLLFNNAIGFFSTRLSTFIIGRLSGAQALGFYTLAYEIASLPTSELLLPINRALFPGFARIVHDHAQLRKTFLEVIAATTLFVTPAAFGIAAIAEPLVLVMLSEKWLQVVPLLKILAFLGAVFAITNNAYPVYLALGRARTTTMLAVGRLILMVPAMILAGRAAGVIGIAWAELIVTIVFMPINVSVLLRILEIPFLDLVGRLWRPLVAAVVMYVVVRESLALLAAAGLGPDRVVALCAGVLIGAVTYLVGIGVLWAAFGRGEGAEARILQLVRERLQQRPA